MKIEYKLIDGTIVIGDKHIDSDYYTNVIRIYKPEDNSELEDCTYDVTCVKESDIVYRKFINLDYDDLMEYISLVEQTIKEELKILYDIIPIIDETFVDLLDELIFNELPI